MNGREAWSCSGQPRVCMHTYIHLLSVCKGVCPYACVCLSVGVHMCVSMLEYVHVHLGHTPWLYVLYMWAWGRVCMCWYLRVCGVPVWTCV